MCDFLRGKPVGTTFPARPWSAAAGIPHGTPGQVGSPESRSWGGPAKQDAAGQVQEGLLLGLVERLAAQQLSPSALYVRKGKQRGASDTCACDRSNTSKLLRFRKSFEYSLVILEKSYFIGLISQINVFGFRRRLKLLTIKLREGAIFAGCQAQLAEYFVSERADKTL
jgi:hypothetical protein